MGALSHEVVVSRLSTIKLGGRLAIRRGSAGIQRLGTSLLALLAGSMIVTIAAVLA